MPEKLKIEKGNSVVQQETEWNFFHRGGTMPFYVLLHISVGAEAVPKWENYVHSCFGKGTAKLILKEIIYTVWKK